MKKEKLVVDGNAFYEVDLDCIEKKKNLHKKKAAKPPALHHPQKRQRN